MAADPFRSLELGPFLHLDPNTEKNLRAHVLKLSRNFHPDRIVNGSDEARQEAESKSAEINQSWKLIQDAWQRVDWVLKTEVGPHKTQSQQSLPELAMEYFSLQEALEEKPEAADKLRGGFAVELTEKLSSLESTREKITKSYSLDWENRRAAKWPPSAEDLERLLALYQQRNYIKRMLENLSSPMPKGPLY